MPAPRLFLAVIAGVLTVAGCRFLPCSTATCLADRAIADWPDDPAGVTHRVAALSDEFTRVAVVSRLCETYPCETGGLCEALPPGPSRQRCERLNDRPHLSIAPDAAGRGQGGRTGDVPDRDATGPTAAPASPSRPSFPEVTLPLAPLASPPDDTCAGAADRSACLDQAALDAVLAGDASAADAICARHAESRWADECRFASAESAVRSRHEEAYPAAARLCGASSRFSQECWSHVLTRLPKRVQPVGAGVAKVRSAASTARIVRRTWAEAGDAVAEVHVGRFWALYFANVYRYAVDPVGTPLEVYPEEAWPHVRAAAAVRLHALGRLDGTLTEQVDGLRAALARRDPTAAGEPQRPDLVYVADLGAPATEPTVSFLGAPRRPLGADEAQDLVFCVLESAARRSPPDTAVLHEGTASTDSRVAAESRRLLEAVTTGSR
ncbi:MAG: hypothetical protein ACK4YP_11325 [Myxococcota bacterium]